ncbi:MATE family efflux transporter [Natranaeroarchaeum sulfidigenes]|uniref:Na+-driven multidrug efflux pump n=1 Tax=Natranaeroarchaeum sulfidigenes TaxID=2784880 RepID=A0A897MT67_9EURY|nr:MATE family efflux transporter [Natranaeroarchaeum sulfidigenes]QSG01415.1 Na+-driven multidrug efflux pump [Natranaeroarchaeum sulfidigenes]
MSDDRSVDLTEGRLLVPLLVLSGPIVASQLLQVSYNLIDTYFVGRLGADAVAALGFALPFAFLMISLGSGLTVAGTVLVAQHKGAGNEEKVARVAGQTITFVSITSVLLAAIGYVLAPVLLPYIGTDPGTATHRMAVEYTRTIFLGVVFMFGFFIFQAILRGWGDTRTPLYLMVLSVSINIVLDPFLILGFENNPLFEWAGLLDLQADLLAATGFTGYGVQGAAIATVFSRGVGAAIGFWLLFTGRVGIDLSFADLKPEMAVVRKILDVGGPSGLERGADSLAYTGMTALVGLVSADAVAAYGIGNRINTLVYLPAVGLAQGTETAVGQNLGAGKQGRARKAVLLSSGIIFAVLAVFSVLAFVFAETIVSIFIEGEGAEIVVEKGTDYFKIIGPTYVFMGLFQVLNAGFRGAGSTRTAFIFSVLAQWGLRIPPTLVFITILAMGATGVWWGIAFSHVAAAIVVAAWFLVGDWDQSVIEEDEDTSRDGGAEGTVNAAE